MKVLAFALQWMFFQIGLFLLGNLEVDVDNPVDYRQQLGWFGRLREDIASTILSWSSHLYHRYVMTEEERRDIDQFAQQLVTKIMAQVAVEDQGNQK